MKTYLPGSAIEMIETGKGAAEKLLTGLYIGGDLVLSQVAKITGLESHMIQNWVARGFLPPPKNKKYTRRQLSRILIINMLRSVLPLDEICSLLSYVNGHLNDESDDSIDDARLYIYMVRMTIEGEEDCCGLLGDYAEPYEGAKKRVEAVLQIMATAYAASELKRKAEEMIKDIVLVKKG
jgi:DNA-binding transcriptional MerR regulator